MERMPLTVFVPNPYPPLKINSTDSGPSSLWVRNASENRSRSSREAKLLPADTLRVRLIDLLGSGDKQLLGYSGTHAQTKPAAVGLWRDFITAYLAPGVPVTDSAPYGRPWSALRRRRCT
jgi:hypothetical protein